MLEISIDGSSEIIEKHESLPLIEVNNAAVIFSFNEEVADAVIEEYVLPKERVDSIFIYNYDDYQDIESYKKGLEKLFFNCIFKNNDFVNNVFVLNLNEDFYNATKEQILASQKKITKLDGTKWPDVDTTNIKILSWVSIAAFDGKDLNTSFFAEISREYKQTTVETPLDYIPEGYAETDETGTAVSYTQVDYYDNYYYTWPIVKNVSNFYRKFIFGSSSNDSTLTARAYKLVRTEYVKTGSGGE